MMEAAMKSGREAVRKKKIGPGPELAALYKKELTDHIRSKRFLIILALIAVTAAGSLYGALSGMQEAVSSSETEIEFVFLRLFTTSGDGIPSFISFISLLGPLVGLTLGFDAINGERSRGTLNLLIAQPIHRDAVINGKFLAGLTVIAGMVCALGLLISGIGLIATGVPPTGEELLRLVVFLLVTIVYIAFWLGLSILFSALCRHTATSAMAVIALWLLFAIFLSMLADIIANALFPVTETSRASALIDNYTCSQAINHISPAYLYSEAVSAVMDPSVRAMGLVTQSQLSGAVVGPLDLDQSLLLVWQNLTGLIALTMLSFVASYVCFMRQEVRAG